MKRRKLRILMLVLSLFLICIVTAVIFARTIIVKIPTSPFLLKLVVTGLFVKELSSLPPMPPPSEVFRQHIMDAIPESVTNIKADRPSIIGGYTYVLRFNISRTDLDSIINSRPFQRVWNVEYRNGNLDWAWDRSGPFGIPRYISSKIIYDRQGPRRPAWFKLELWDNPEAYAFEKVGDRVNTEIFGYKQKVHDRNDTQVLLYNEKEGEAYFIVSHF